MPEAVVIGVKVRDGGPEGVGASADQSPRMRQETAAEVGPDSSYCTYGGDAGSSRAASALDQNATNDASEDVLSCSNELDSLVVGVVEDATRQGAEVAGVGGALATAPARRQIKTVVFAFVLGVLTATMICERRWITLVPKILATTADPEDLLPLPVWQLWDDTCKQEGLPTGRYGPWSRELPEGAAAAVPSVRAVAEYLLRLPNLEKAAQACKTLNLTNSNTSSNTVKIVPDQVLCLRPRQGQEARRFETVVPWMKDAVVMVDDYLEYLGFANETIILQIGDGVSKSPLPIWKKARWTDRSKEPFASLMLLNIARHFGQMIDKRPWKITSRLLEYQWPVQELKVCTPFKERRQVLAWRGVSTGRWRHDETPRDRKALMTHWGSNQSARIDVGITKYVQGVKGEDAKWGTKGSLTQANMSSNMFLTMPEGNDVASGSSWSLFSASVMLMPRPQHETVVFHGLLQEWVHYIPVRDDYSDLESKMQWCVDNLDKCEDIAHRATLFMYHWWPGSARSRKALQLAFQKYFDAYREVVDCACHRS